MGTTPAARTIRTTRARVAAGLAGGVVAALAWTAPSSVAAAAAPPTDRGGPPPVGHELPKVPVMTGSGGAVASVDPVASQVGIDVLAAGGNATDAAIATAAALGVTEPYSTGIGGGGFFVHQDGASGEVETIDGRETAPATFTETSFIDPATGLPRPFATVVSSGLSVGVPGTPATWERAAERWGTERLGTLLKPAERIARNGFVVDQTFHDQTVANATRFAFFPETARVFLPGGAAPAVGSVFRNPDLARAYRELRTHGVDSLYTGRLGEAVVAEVRDPGTAPGGRGARGRADDRRPRGLPRARQGADPLGVPRHGRLRDAGAEQRRDRRRRDPQPHRGLRRAHGHADLRGRRRAVPPPVLRGERDGVRRPQPLGGRRAGSPDATSCCRRPSPTSAPACSTRPRAHPRPVPFGAPTAAYAECGAAAAAGPAGP